MKPLDPALAAIAGAIPPDAPSLFAIEPAQARAIFDAMAMGRPTAGSDGVAIEDRLIPSPSGDLPIRIYRPAEAGTGATIVFLHGGGYMLGGVRQMDREARLLCEKASAVVVSVDYRLAPENPLPAAHDDAVAALLWAADNAPALGGDAAKLGVAGESAGANIAASAAIALRDLRVPLAAQLLIVPAPDFVALGQVGEREGTYPMLANRDIRAIVQRVLPAPEAAAQFPFSARHAASLAQLPPAVIALAGHCPTRQIGEDYAEALRMAGNAVHLYCFEDMFHPFFAFADASPAAMAAVDTLVAEFGSVLAAR